MTLWHLSRRHSLGGGVDRRYGILCGPDGDFATGLHVCYRCHGDGRCSGIGLGGQRGVGKDGRILDAPGVGHVRRVYRGTAPEIAVCLERRDFVVLENHSVRSICHSHDGGSGTQVLGELYFRAERYLQPISIDIYRFKRVPYLRVGDAHVIRLYCQCIFGGRGADGTGILP